MIKGHYLIFGAGWDVGGREGVGWGDGEGDIGGREGQGGLIIILGARKPFCTYTIHENMRNWEQEKTFFMYIKNPKTIESR